MKQVRVLVVDDEELARETICEILVREGYSATGVESAEAALQLAKGDCFDLLLADIKMPKKDGLELVEEFREISPQTIPILITGYPSIETARIAISQGVYNYITKPFDRGEICLALADALGRKRLADENARLKQLTGLYKVSQAVAIGTDEKELMGLILSTAIRETRSSGGAIVLFNSFRDQVRIAAASGAWEWAALIANAILKKDITPPSGASKPILFTNVEDHPLFGQVGSHYPSNQVLTPRAKHQEILMLPIETEGGTIGFLTTSRAGGEGLFSEGDLELLTILASQLAICLKSRWSVSEVEENCLKTLRLIASQVDRRTPYTHSHMEQVANLGMQLGKIVGLSEDKIRNIELGARLHDIGLLGVSEAILNKPALLTPPEWEMVKLHPVIGDDLIAPLPFLADARQIVRHHHERLDGSGYPDGLSWDEITPALHVVLLCDAYDAMTSARPWRPAIPRDDAMATLYEDKGTKFDPNITDAFIDMLRAGT